MSVAVAFDLSSCSCSTWCGRIVPVAVLLGRGGVQCRAPACQQDAGAPPVLSVASLQMGESWL